MAVNAEEDRQVVVVIKSPEPTCTCPEKKKNAAAICMVHAQVRGTVAQSFGLSATTLSRYLSGTFIKRMVRLFLQKNRSVSLWNICLSSLTGWFL
jgi:hypothetical protein